MDTLLDKYLESQQKTLDKMLEYKELVETIEYLSSKFIKVATELTFLNAKELDAFIELRDSSR